MNARAAVLLILVMMTGALAPAQARRELPKKNATIRVGVLTRPPGPNGEEALQAALTQADARRYSLLLSVGLKGAQESCDDKTYQQHKKILNQARAPLVVAPAGSDWAECKELKNHASALERLNSLRELLFGDGSSLGRERIRLTRLSDNAKYRSFAENAHWQVGRVLFATINLPAPNNNFRPEAGRNSEFEDRAIANRDWLARLFSLASVKKLDGIVLISDANLFATPGKDSLRELAAAGSRDGLQEMRKQLASAMQRYNGRVLLIDGQPAPAGNGPRAIAGTIRWRGKLGHLQAGTPSKGAWIGVAITPGTPELFAPDKS